MANYYRITAYHKEKDISIIMDSYGYFEKKWQFSADLIRRGFDIIEVSDDTQFLDGNIERLTVPKQDKLTLRSCSMGKPKYISKDKKKIEHKTVVVGNKEYIPNKTIES